MRGHEGTRESQVLRHADAELGADVFAVERDFDKARAFVDGDRVWLAWACFEDEAPSTELAGDRFELNDDALADAAAAGLRRDVHPLDLGFIAFDASDGAAADGLAIGIRN